MPVTIIDHLCIAALFVVLPIEGVFAIRRLLNRINAGDRGARSRVFIQTIVLQWLLAVALLVHWQYRHRPWPDLGFRWGTVAGAVIGAAFLALVAGFLYLQHASVRKLTDAQVAKVRLRARETFVLLPYTGKERRLFALTAITAGCCEELLCRGFVFWYLGQVMNPWLSVVVASAAFGAAHAYQGRKGVIRTGVAGAMFGAVFVLTQSLIYPAVGHMVIDLAALGVSRRLAFSIEPLGADAKPDLR